ncbi:MAG: TonB-dependent receptor [Gammaproteobacteria bacterium]|nr:TonB-dependent receptor [Gammaproteobacteria bacterium]
MKSEIKLVLAMAAAVCSALPTAASFAQNDSGNSLALEEIVVSARKRDESLQEVPIAVDVFTEARLQQLSIDTVSTLARYTPSLTYDQGVLPMDTRPVIRGANALRGRPNVGILVDFVDVSSEALTVAGGGITANLALLDVERVEVIKGPQNALYGRSAFTGAINYVTKKPGDEFEGHVTVGYDEDSSSEFGFSLSGPVIDDKMGARVSFMKDDQKGDYRNPNTGQFLGSSETIGGAIALTYQFNDSIDTYFRYERSNYQATPRAEAFIQALTPQFDPAVNFLGTGTVTDAATSFPHMFPATCNGIDRLQPNYDSFGLGPTCRALVTGQLHATEADIDLSPDPRTGRDFLGSDIDISRFHYDIDVDFDNGMEFRYILGYADSKAHVQEDFDKSNNPIVAVPFGPFPFSQYGLSAMSEQRIDTSQWNHELRLSGNTDRIDWKLSLLHWTETMDSQFDDEWWLREGGDPALVLNLLNDTPGAPFNYLQQPIAPPFVNNFCDLIYPGVAGCVPRVTSLATGPGNTPYVPLHRETKHSSIAGLVSINVTDNFVVSLEGRYLDEVIDYAGGAADIGFFSQFGQDPWWGFMFGPGEMTYNSVEEDEFVPKVTFDWSLSDDMLMYGYYSQAFKPGGISTTDANGDVTTGEYTSEKLDTYEFGFKSTLRDRSIRLNAAAFFYDYTDQQVPYQFISPTTGLLQTTVINAGETEIKGYEVDLTWNSAFLEGLSARISYTHTDAEFTSFNLTDILAQAGGTPNAFNRVKAGNNEADFSGKIPPLTPEDAATASLRMDANFDSGMSGYVELLAVYNSERFVGEGNLAWLPQYTELDLFAGLARDNWELTFYVTNLSNDDKVKSGLGNVDYALLPDGQSVPQAVSLYLPTPRTAGMRFRYSFGE